MKICKILLILFVYFTALTANCAEINIHVDKPSVTDGDTFRLTVTYNGDDNQKPDFSTLQQDFSIISTSSSSQFNFINGNISQSKTWVLELRPKKLGKITIKPIKLGDITSNYTQIEVTELSNVAQIPDNKGNNNSPHFQIEQSIFPTTPYIQQQIIILVTIYDSIGLQNGQININEEARKNWSIVSLSDTPIVKQDVIDGKKMNVVTFAFAAFPQKSGELISPQFSFEGYYFKNNDFELADFDNLMALGFNFQNVLGQKVPVRMRTKTEKISVKPIPNEFSGSHWLPLKNLTVESSIPSQTAFKVGDAISRHLKLTAVGVPQNMLPTIKFPETSAFKQYPEQPETVESIVSGDIVTTATINTVYIPTKSGKQQLPALEIEWFNVETQKAEKTIVPAEEIFINDSPYTSSTLTETTPPMVEQTAPINQSPKEHKHNISFTKYGIVFGMIIAFVVFIFAILFLFRKPKNIYRKRVINTIRKHDYKATRAALLDWANFKFSRTDITNLNMIAEAINQPDFSEQLSLLNKFLYSETEELFDSVKFIEIFKKVDKIKLNMYKNDKTLPNLYN